jgi:hypothetical protein
LVPSAKPNHHDDASSACRIAHYRQVTTLTRGCLQPAFVSRAMAAPPSKRVALVTTWIAAWDVTNSQLAAYCRQVPQTTAEQEDTHVPLASRWPRNLNPFNWIGVNRVKWSSRIASGHGWAAVPTAATAHRGA